MLQYPLSRFSPRRLTTSHRACSQHFRSVLALGLAALLFLAPLSFRISAQETGVSSKPTQAQAHQFTLYQDESGNVACRAATLEERIQSESINPASQGLRQINHLKREYTDYAHSATAQTGTNGSTGLTIILRATTQLQNNTPALNAFNRAAQNWENLIQTPVTVYMDVDFGTTNFGTAWPANVLGSTSTPSRSYPYQSVRTNLVAEATGEGNPTKQAIFNALPSTNVPTDLGSASTTDVPDSIARAIGLLNPTALSTDSASRIAFNSNFSYDFDPTDGITPGQTDFDAVATHEIGHALGFDSDAGEGLARPAVWDLYRFRTGTTSGTFSTDQRIMTIGGSPDSLQYYLFPDNVNAQQGLSTGGPNGSTTNGGDGWQSSHWRHSSSGNGVAYIGIMDPAIPSGVRRQLTSNDALALGSFGYNLNNSVTPPPPPPPPAPPANDNFANAQTINGCSGSVTGTNISATKETGEPNNPDSPTSIPSVWYQWTAPSSGSVTIDTHGSDFDTVLAIYTGNSLGTLSLVGHSDDTSSSDLTSTIPFTATQGTVYRIAVNGYNNGGSGGDTGGIKLNWNASTCTSSTPTTPVITWSNPADITYGTTLSSTQLNATANVPGTFSYTPAAGTLLNAGSGQPLSVNFTPTDTTNYTSASKSVQINVLQAGVTAINFSNTTQTYDGTPKSPTVTTNPPGLNVTVTYNGSSTAPINAGSYQVVAAVNDNNYLPFSRIGGLTIDKAMPTITWSNPAGITYGAGLGSTQLNATANVPGVFTYTPPAGMILSAGNNQTLSANFTPTDATNYNSTSKTVSINVSKANQTINFDLIPSKTFGDADFTVNASASSGLAVTFASSGNCTMSGATVHITSAGSCTITASQGGNSNYNIASSVSHTFSIVSANANITLTNLAYIYDGTAKFATATTNPAGKSVTITYSQNGAPVISPINAGSYDVTATINDPNFQGTTTGTLVINKATPLITWNNPVAILSGTALSNTQLNATANVPGSFLYNVPAGTVLSVGTYQLAVTFIPTDVANYNAVAASVSLTVNPATTVQLSASSYSVSKHSSTGQSFATIIVNRTGDLSGASTVKYATSDSTDVNFRCNPNDPNAVGQPTSIASRKCDYHIAVGRLRFAAGESSKQILVSILDNAYTKGTLTFNITLSNPTGATLGTPITATISITDNGVGGANPIDGTNFYVRQLYVDLLSREPDPSGWNGWINRIDLCGQAGQAPPPCDRVTVGGDGFLRSAEFFDREFFVLRLYRAGLGRIPQYTEVGDLAYVSGFLSSSDLELNKQELVADIMSRSEFSTKYNGLGNLSFVDTLLQTANVSVPQSVHDAWVNNLNNSSETRAQVYRELSERQEVSDKYLHEAQVVSAYYGFFSRNPDGAAYSSYLPRLDSGQITLGDLANAFVNSLEYRQRFGAN